MKRIISSLLCLIIVISGFTVSADSNFEEYTYNTKGESVEAPQTYEPVSVIYGGEENGINFSSPKDIDTDLKGNLYILDSGNNRIAVYNEALKLSGILEAPTVENEQLSFKDCTGIFIRNEEIYISDKVSGRIYVIGTDGTGKRVLNFKPLPVVSKDFAFKPVHLTVDEAGIIQVQVEGCYNGLITLNQNGEMIGYFSANTIKASLSVIAAQFWRKIFSDEQQNNIKQIIPVEYSSLTMDKFGFVYTTTKKTEDSTFEIKKLNPYGDNILGYNTTDKSVKIGNGDYGDMQIFHTDGQDKDTTFEDIYVDDEDFVFAVDTTRGRVFQYDQNSNLISIFGGMGDQKGTFSLPVAISGWKGRIFVLDQNKNNLTVFEANEYVRNIRTALQLDEECDYDSAVTYWEKVYSDNSNYSLALSGLGKYAYQKGDLKLAMKYFERADDRANYDIAYNAYRTKFIRENFLWFGLAALVIVAAAITLSVCKRRKIRK